MEPKEEAKKLVDKIHLTNKLINYDRAKTIALLCVDEIDNALQNISALHVIGNVLLDQIKYYQEVKQEIINLK